MWMVPTGNNATAEQEAAELTMGQWVVGQWVMGRGSNGSTNLDWSRGWHKRSVLAPNDPTFH